MKVTVDRSDKRWNKYSEIITECLDIAILRKLQLYFQKMDSDWVNCQSWLVLQFNVVGDCYWTEERCLRFHSVNQHFMCMIINRWLCLYCILVHFRPDIVLVKMSNARSSQLHTNNPWQTDERISDMVDDRWSRADYEKVQGRRALAEGTITDGGRSLADRRNK